MKGLFLALLLVAFTAHADKPLSEKTRQLAQLNQEIQHLKRTLDSSKDKRGVLLIELQDTDLEISKLTMLLESTQENYAEQQTILQKLKADTQQAQAKLMAQQDLLNRQIRAAYQLGSYQTVKLLFNQEKSQHISRMLTYYDYINQARNQLIEDINQGISQLHNNKQAITEHANTLAILLENQQQQQQALQQKQSFRKVLLDQLNTQIESHTSTLNELKQNKIALENLLKTLQAKSDTIAQSLPFEQMKQKLPWPAGGKVLHLFGKPIQDSEITYNGIRIKAKPGAPVKAIYPGKVVFSGWLRGFGLLLILDHGQGYLSLYAHNQSLFKEKGDTVKTGEALASIGKSSEDSQDGLYFEIRYNGKPLDPVSWLTKNQHQLA